MDNFIVFDGEGLETSERHSSGNFGNAARDDEEPPPNAHPAAAKEGRNVMEKISAVRSAGRAMAIAIGLGMCLPPSAVAQDKPILVAVALNHQTEKRWAFDQAAMEAEAAKNNVKLLFQWALMDPIKQKSQVENLLGQNPDALILDPAEAKTSGDIVNEAHEAGIPVIAYDDVVTGAKVDYYVTRDNYKVGALQISGAIKAAPSGNYALIKGDVVSEVAHHIAQAWTDELAKHSGVKVVYDQWTPNWNPSTAQASAENSLSANNDNIQAFVVMNDGMAAGTAQALKGRDLDGKVFLTGLDGDTSALKLVASGAQSMTVFGDIVDGGTWAVKAAVALAKKQTPEHDAMVDLGAGEVPVHYMSIYAVSKDNLCEFVTKQAPKGWTTVDEVFGNAGACK